MSPAGARLKDEGSRLQVIGAGAVAGLVSRFIIAPLDVVKIRLQLQSREVAKHIGSETHTPHYHGTISTLRHILRHEGITGFWKGNVPAELMYVCYASIQFTAYRSTTMFLQSGLPYNLPDSVESFVAGASSGAAATTATYPLDLLRTRFAAQGTNKVYKSLMGAVGEIYRDESWRGFFRGLGPALAQIVPYMGMFFVAYEGLRLPMGEMNLPWGTGDATAGILGSVIAKTAVFPLDLVRKRIQVQGPTRGRYVYGDIPVYRTTVGAIRTIAAREGLRGLYKGLPISLIKAAPASAVTVWTYERSLNFMLAMDSKDDETHVQ
ncbi:hypothetical protein Golomagni_06963 [Golovinomyces magnicellulatus]|nr:hypothetical protein Golomagni_06963 [Golovinomyces magnicellulatus]